MVCPKCGMSLPDDAVFCAQCGASVQGAQDPNQTFNAQQPPMNPPQYNNYSYQTQQPMGEKPINGTTYLIFAILATVLCCLPFGIPAIIFATKIDKAQATGDFAGAADAAKKSKMWSIIAAVGSIVYMIIIVAFTFAGVAGNMYY